MPRMFLNYLSFALEEGKHHVRKIYSVGRNTSGPAREAELFAVLDGVDEKTSYTPSRSSKRSTPQSFDGLLNLARLSCPATISISASLKRTY